MVRRERQFSRSISLMLKALAISLLFVSSILPAQQLTELTLLQEHPIANMPEANLSGIAVCGSDLLFISDRKDDALYKISNYKQLPKKMGVVLSAELESFTPPKVPKDSLSAKHAVINIAASVVRGGVYDFEGIACDAMDNRYIVSEAYLAVLQVTKTGQAKWLDLPDELWSQAKQTGLLQKVNETLEGIAISPDGKQLWLAAERNLRGLLTVIYDDNKGWHCPAGNCVLLAEGGSEPLPKQFRRKNRVMTRDFSDLVFYGNKLFTLERGAYRICRRDLTGRIEQCWSIAKALLQPQRQYKKYGMPEALWIDDNGAWIGVDNDMANPRVDGETRPVIWYFASPNEGWLATKSTNK